MTTDQQPNPGHTHTQTGEPVTKFQVKVSAAGDFPTEMVFQTRRDEKSANCANHLSTTRSTVQVATVEVSHKSMRVERTNTQTTNSRKKPKRFK